MGSGYSAYFFQKLPAAAFFRGLAGIQLAGGDLGEDVVVGVAALPHHIDLSVLRQGHHADAAGLVVDHFPGGFPSVGQGDPVFMDVEDPSVEDVLS